MQAYLGNSIKRPANVENTLWIARNALRDHNTCATLLTNLINMGATFANDDGGVLGDDQASHMDVGGGRRRRSCGGWLA